MVPAYSGPPQNSKRTHRLADSYTRPRAELTVPASGTHVIPRVRWSRTLMPFSAPKPLTRVPHPAELPELTRSLGITSPRLATPCFAWPRNKNATQTPPLSSPLLLVSSAASAVTLQGRPTPADPFASASPAGDRRTCAATRRDHGGHRGSEGEAADHAAASPQAVGASAAGSRPPRAFPASCLRRRRRRARSAPFVVDVPPTRRHRRERRRRGGGGAPRRRAGGSPGQAHGPPPRRRRPSPPAPGAEAPASVAGPRASLSTPSSAAGGRCSGCGGRKDVEPEGAEASSSVSPREQGGVGSHAVVGEAAGGRRRARPVHAGAGGGRDRGGHLRPDRRPAAAAASEAAARRAAAARFAAPGVVADRDHRRRLPGSRRLANGAPAPAGRRPGLPLPENFILATRFSQVDRYLCFPSVLL